MSLLSGIFSELSGEVVKKALVGVLATLLTGGVVSLYQNTQQQWIEISDQWKEMREVVEEVKRLRAEMNFVNGTREEWRLEGVEPNALPATPALEAQTSRLRGK